jgi:hypothetical protein
MPFPRDALTRDRHQVTATGFLQAEHLISHSRGEVPAARLIVTRKLLPHSGLLIE